MPLPAVAFDVVALAAAGEGSASLAAPAPFSQSKNHQPCFFEAVCCKKNVDFHNFAALNSDAHR